MSDLRTFTLWARGKLTQEAEELLLQIYGLESSGRFLAEKKLPVLSRTPAALETRARLEKLLSDEEDAGFERIEAYRKLVKEVAFTHLNRLVALKLMEGRKLIRGAVDRYHESNGFKMYLAGHEKELKLFEQGSMPQDDFSEGPSDRAYRHFLLWEYGELAKEIRVLFDPENAASALFPRPRVLKEIIDALNSDDLTETWAIGNEETIGWVYQYFNAEEKATAFDRVFKKKQRFRKVDIPAATQVFTPRWIVKFLVQNSLGRLWLSMHPDSNLAATMEYLVSSAADPPGAIRKSVKEIQILDPATGTMHFGLIAFDLLANMYLEEIAHAGQDGWPADPPVMREDEIPAAILANNLFGIDIDLRAVQLAALALYLRAKSLSRNAVLSESNLACADVALFRGPHRDKIAGEMSLPRGVKKELFDRFCETLDEASLMGSLVRVERLFQEKIRADELRTSIDAYVRKKAAEGVDESYFGGETAKGLRLLEVLTRRYDVVFTNPPYMSKNTMDSVMAEFLKHNYKKSKGDLYSGFIERCAELLAESGRLAMITQQSFMFISTCEDLRLLLLANAAIETMAHLGPRAFPEVPGEKVNTTAFVLRRESYHGARDESIGVYFRLVREPDSDGKRTAFERALELQNKGERDPSLYHYRQRDFAAIPGSPWVYWITRTLRERFVNLPALKQTATAKQGLATADNQRFIRFWWEIGLRRIDRQCTSAAATLESCAKWFPHMKGGGSLRWYGYRESVVNWARDGAEIRCFGEETGRIASRPQNTEYYFKRGLTYSAVSGKGFACRLMPEGFCFDCAGDCLFPKEPQNLLGYLALLNSSVTRGFLSFINPTLNVNTEDLDRLPIPRRLTTRLSSLAESAISLAESVEAEDDTSYDYVAPPPWPDGGDTVTRRLLELSDVESQIDEEVYRLYEMSDADRKAIQLEIETAPAVSDDEGAADANNHQPEAELCEKAFVTRQELAARWVAYAVGIALGRFEPGVEAALGRGRFTPAISDRVRSLAASQGIMVFEEGHPDDLAQRVLDILHTLYGDAEAENIVRTATAAIGSLRQAVEGYLLGPFFREHVRHYRKRPVFWLLQSPNRGYSVYLFHEQATENTLSLIQGKTYLGGRIRRVDADLQHAKKMEAGTTGRDKTEWTKKARESAELLDDLRAFDRSITAANNFSITDRDGGSKIVRWQPEFDDGVLLNAAPLHELTPAWKRVDAKLDLKKVWKDIENGEYNWAKTAMRYWPQHVLKDCRKNKSFAIAHGLA